MRTLLRVLLLVLIVRAAVEAGLAASRHKYVPPKFNSQSPATPASHAPACTSESCAGLPDDLVPECKDGTCPRQPQPSKPAVRILVR